MHCKIVLNVLNIGSTSSFINVKQKTLLSYLVLFWGEGGSAKTGIVWLINSERQHLKPVKQIDMFSLQS